MIDKLTDASGEVLDANVTWWAVFLSTRNSLSFVLRSHSANSG